MSNGMANFVICEAKFVMHEGKNIQWGKAKWSQMSICTAVHCLSKKDATFIFAITLANVDRF